MNLNLLPANQSFKTLPSSTLFMAALVITALLLSPLYLWQSGYPQLSDGVFCLAILIMLGQFLNSGQVRLDETYLLILALGLLTTVVNLVYYIFYQDPRLFFSSLYYIYNGFVFILIAYLFNQAPQFAARLIYIYIFCTVAYQVILSLVLPEYSGSRFIGTFNNPNQMAFWCLFTCCTLVMVRINSKFKPTDYILLMGLMYLQSLALSKAGLICSILFLLALPFSPVMGKIERITVGALGVIFLIFCMFSYAELNDRFSAFQFIDRSIERLENIGQESDDNARARGYHRLLKYPEYLIAGAGEGAYYRFNDMAQLNEIHSALGTMLFSYGILGISLFLAFLYAVSRKTHRFFIVLLFLVLLNGMTHQNIRFTHMWIFVGTAYGMRHLLNVRDRTKHLNDDGLSCGDTEKINTAPLGSKI